MADRATTTDYKVLHAQDPGAQLFESFVVHEWFHRGHWNTCMTLHDTKQLKVDGIRFLPVHEVLAVEPLFPIQVLIAKIVRIWPLEKEVEPIDKREKVTGGKAPPEVMPGPAEK